MAVATFFRAKINTKLKALSGLWSGIGQPVLIGILASFIYEKSLGPSSVVIQVDDPMVTIQSDGGRIIILRSTYDARAAHSISSAIFSAAIMVRARRDGDCRVATLLSMT